MELNTTTFILEIVNFIVLVWILKRFLYVPILKAIQARKDAVQKTLDSAEHAKKEAATLNEQYESRLQDWEKEKETARAEFRREMEQERVRAMAALDISLKAEREKAMVTSQQRLTEILEKQETQATEQALKFTASLLRRIVSPELEQRLIETFLDDLGNIPSAKLREWKARFNSQRGEASVQTAFPISKALEDKITARLSEILTEAPGQAPQLKFEQDPSLVAGIRLNAGLLVFHADLRDELASFSEARLS